MILLTLMVFIPKNFLIKYMFNLWVCFLRIIFTICLITIIANETYMFITLIQLLDCIDKSSSCEVFIAYLTILSYLLNLKCLLNPAIIIFRLCNILLSNSYITYHELMVTNLNRWFHHFFFNYAIWHLISLIEKIPIFL